VLDLVPLLCPRLGWEGEVEVEFFGSLLQLMPSTKGKRGGSLAVITVAGVGDREFADLLPPAANAREGGKKKTGEKKALAADLTRTKPQGRVSLLRNSCKPYLSFGRRKKKEEGEGGEKIANHFPNSIFRIGGDQPAYPLPDARGRKGVFELRIPVRVAGHPKRLAIAFRLVAHVIGGKK